MNEVMAVAGHFNYTSLPIRMLLTTHHLTEASLKDYIPWPAHKWNSYVHQQQLHTQKEDDWQFKRHDFVLV